MSEPIHVGIPESPSTSIGAAFASAARKSSEVGAKKLAAAVKGETSNPIMTVFGAPQWEPGNGREYAATEYGSKVPIPGKFNATLAVAHFTLGVFSQSVKIARERTAGVKDGKKVWAIRTYVQVPKNLTYDRKDPLVVAHVDNWKVWLMGEYKAWLVKSGPIHTTRSLLMRRAEEVIEVMEATEDE